MRVTLLMIHPSIGEWVCELYMPRPFCGDRIRCRGGLIVEVVGISLYVGEPEMVEGPQIDDSEFLRKATLRLCSHLEIEQGLSACVQYVARFMPADSMYLQRQERDLSSRSVRDP